MMKRVGEKTLAEGIEKIMFALWLLQSVSYLQCKLWNRRHEFVQNWHVELDHVSGVTKCISSSWSKSYEFFKRFITKTRLSLQLKSVPSLCSWKFWKIQNFDPDGQLDSIAPEARSTPTARRGRNYLEFFKIFMNIGTDSSINGIINIVLTMSQSVALASTSRGFRSAPRRPCRLNRLV